MSFNHDDDLALRLALSRDENLLEVDVLQLIEQKLVEQELQLARVLSPFEYERGQPTTFNFLRNHSLLQDRERLNRILNNPRATPQTTSNLGFRNFSESFHSVPLLQETPLTLNGIRRATPRSFSQTTTRNTSRIAPQTTSTRQFEETPLRLNCIPRTTAHLKPTSAPRNILQTNSQTTSRTTTRRIPAASFLRNTSETIPRSTLKTTASTAPLTTSNLMQPTVRSGQFLREEDTANQTENDNLQLAIALSLSEAETGNETLITSNLSDTEQAVQQFQQMSFRNQNDGDENTCSICRDTKSTHAFIPCGHRVVCATCSVEIKRRGPLKCILCRATASGIYQIF